MPTHKGEDSFWQDWHHLTEDQQDAFLAAIDKMVDELREPVVLQDIAHLSHLVRFCLAIPQWLPGVAIRLG
jgi:hypothetical protein